MLLSSRLFGFGGAPRRARNWRYALALTVNTGAIQKRVLGCTPGRVKDEIRAVLASQFRRSINQFAYVGFDAKVQRFTLGCLMLCHTHIVFLNPV